MYTAASYISSPSTFTYPRSCPYLPDHNQESTDGTVEKKQRSRTIPEQEKDVIYYEKRARNNESAKRSRDTRRIREEQIQERVNFLEQENSRLAMENQAIRYQLSQFHTFSNGISKPFP